MKNLVLYNKLYKILKASKRIEKIIFVDELQLTKNILQVNLKRINKRSGNEKNVASINLILILGKSITY